MFLSTFPAIPAEHPDVNINIITKQMMILSKTVKEYKQEKQTLFKLINNINGCQLVNYRLPYSQAQICAGNSRYQELFLLVLKNSLRLVSRKKSPFDSQTKVKTPKVFPHFFKEKQKLQLYDKFSIYKTIDKQTNYCQVNIYQVDNSQSFVFEFLILQKNKFLPKKHILHSQILEKYFGKKFLTSQEKQEQIENCMLMLDKLKMCSKFFQPRLGFYSNKSTVYFLKRTCFGIKLVPEIIFRDNVKWKTLKINQTWAIVSIFDVPQLCERWFCVYFI